MIRLLLLALLLFAPAQAQNGFGVRQIEAHEVTLIAHAVIAPPTARYGVVVLVVPKRYGPDQLQGVLLRIRYTEAGGQPKTIRRVVLSERRGKVDPPSAMATYIELGSFEKRPVSILDVTAEDIPIEAE